MLTFPISVAIMLAVVGGSVQWAVRARAPAQPREEADARDH